jgi:hypothetical protein
MHFHTFAQYASLLIAASLTASAKQARATPIGINLGPTYLTSAYASDANEGFAVVSVKGSKAYQDYLADVQQTQASGTGTATHDDESVYTIFYEALATIKTAAEKKVGRPVDIGIISQPLYFNQSTSNVLTAAAKQFQPGFAGQITRFTNAARQAYGLNSCKGFGMNATTCDINEGEHSVIVVDYNNEYLELAIGYVREDICSVRGYKRVKELGESHESTSSYLNDVQQVLQEFRGTYFNTFEFWDYGAHVRGVILSGDASKNGMDEMRRSLAQAWPEQHENRLKDSIDTMFVGAAGAARMAQIEALRNGPEPIEEEDDDHKHHGDHDHDEL